MPQIALLRPVWSSFCVEIFSKIFEPVLLYRCPDIAHQVLIIVQIVDRVQSRAQNLAAFVEVA